MSFRMVVLSSVFLLAACGLGPAEVPEECQAYRGLQLADEGREHVPDGTPVEYASNPPASGPHSTALPWGVYREEQKRERWVHNLEHGGVVLLYNCPEGCDADRDALEALARETPKTANGVEVMVVTPDTRMAKRVAAVAWTWSLELDTVDRAALACFIQLHREQGPESPL